MTVKITRRPGITIVVVLLVGLALLILILSACAANPEVNTPPSGKEEVDIPPSSEGERALPQVEPPEEGEPVNPPPSSEGEGDLPAIEPPEKGHPRLDSRLNQLVSAEKRGETASFAKPRGIELINGSVKVIIEVMPGQMEAATEAAIKAGAKIGSSYKDLLQAVVPIRNLTALAEAESIRFIEIPESPAPAVSN